MKKLDIHTLKQEYIGKTYNWLTVIDVFRENSIIKFVCGCKCGNIVTTRKNYVLSNHTTSCGCYKKSPEKAEKSRQWCKDNPDKVAEQAAKYSQWCKDNPDKVKEKTEKRQLTYESNPEIQIKANETQKTYWRNNHEALLSRVKNQKASRLEARNIDYLEAYADIIHPDDYDLLKTSFISNIRTKCPRCGNYEYHPFSNVFTHNTKGLKKGRSIPLCSKCRCQNFSSSDEVEICNFVRSFYNGSCIRNSREIISPFELDIYYPEKKIAIEYNGDYWHSEEFKPKDYHYNKFKRCVESGITLISIFEHDWRKISYDIKAYIVDTFNSKSNRLSYCNGMINNNFPDTTQLLISKLVMEDIYIHRGSRVYTCGYSVL